MTTLQWLRFLAVVFGVHLWHVEVVANVCYLSQEPDVDQQSKLRWVLSVKHQHRCSCTMILPGGVSVITPQRSYEPYYTDYPIFTDEQAVIHDYFGCYDKFADCHALLKAGNTDDGVYTIYPSQYPHGLEVYCDMRKYTGWIVFQRRTNGSVNFHRNWIEYKEGFGDLNGEFWLGNEILRNLTDSDGDGKWTVRVDLTNEQGSNGFLMKSPFRILGNNYTLSFNSPGIQPIVRMFCGHRLGMEDGSIPDNRITASTQFSSEYQPREGRLNMRSGWGPTLLDKATSWFQVDLQKQVQVEGVITQGLQSTIYSLWVTQYQVQYSNDQNTWEYVGGIEKTFTGNFDQNTSCTSMFDMPIEARYIRIIPKSWNMLPAMRVELIGCKVFEPTDLLICEHRLGMEDGSIPDYRITASSTFDNGNTSGNCQPSNGRLNQMGSGNVVGGWCASENGIDKNASWLQVDFVEHVQIEGVIVQGINDPGSLYGDWRVTAYSVEYSDDQNTWQYVKGTSSDTTQIFTGNADQTTPVTNIFELPIRARSIRIRPIQYEGKSAAMRMELIGCKGDILDWASNRPFSTYDHHDEDEDNCASLTGGWWFNRCLSGIPGVENNLNGEYSNQYDHLGRVNYVIEDSSWNGTRIVKSEMKLRLTSGKNDELNMGDI